jgi:hypothetical protein
MTRWVAVVGGAWLGISALALALAGDTLPFDRPSLAGRAVPAQVFDGTLNLLAALLLVGIAYLVTRRRQPPDLVARSPGRRRAAAELAALTGYVTVAMAGGYVLGHALGDHAFGLHLPGSLYGISNPPQISWIVAWALYNGLVYALVPYLVFRARGYTAEKLNFRSANRRGDLLLIAVILLVETVLELATLGGPLLSLTAGEALRAIPTSLVVNFVGTVLPIAVLIYGIGLPRILRLTGSVPATAVAGGLAYALVHVFDGWTTYGTARNAALSIIFLVLQYFGPGLIKSVLTLRTGNVWVHVWGYHAIAPHATVDAPSVVHLFHH